jgi:hypothetical protein
VAAAHLRTHRDEGAEDHADPGLLENLSTAPRRAGGNHLAHRTELALIIVPIVLSWY